jgi:uroporphyrinogen-III decarboxylase
MMIDLLEDIQRLVDEYLSLNDSKENRRRLACWELEVCARDQWHGRAIDGAFESQGLVPITVDIQHPLWLKLFPQDLAQTFTDPAAYLRFYLQKRVTQFKEFSDDTPLEPIVPIWLHTPFEMSLFGMPYHYYEDKDPLIDINAPVCTNSDELERLSPVDFDHSGMMPMAHRIFEGIQEIAGKSFLVLFPEWTRGPFGVALHIGGYTNALLAMAENPDFFHSLMRRVTDERKNYFQYRSQLTGQPDIPPGSLFNDEIDSGVIGPQHYLEFIKPYEEDLACFHKRISYWHSCGNTGILAKEVVRLDRIDVLDVSGYTDLEKVLSEIGSSAPRLDIRLHPLKDLQSATPEWMEKRVKNVIDLCRRYGIKSMSIRVSGLNPWKSPQADFEQIRLWIEIARRVIDRN